MKHFQTLAASSALAAMPRAVAGTVRAITPRAVLGGPFSEANSSPQQILSDLQAAFNDFRGRNDARLDQIEAVIGDGAARAAAERLGLGGGGEAPPVEPEYTTTFASYFRRGEGEEALRQANSQGYRQAVQAAMSIGDNSSGGYLAPTEWDRRISQAQRATSPMRRLATVRVTGVNAYSTLWNDQQWGSGWVGETAARPATSSAGLSPITFATGEIYAMPAVTQRLLDDAQIDVEQWLAGEVQEEFNRQEGIAFLSGNGANKPFGFLTYIAGGAAETQHPGGTLDVVVSGHATSLGGTDAAAADNLVNFTYGLAAPYRQNATWLMNSQTGAAIAKLKDGQGNYIWREAFQAGQPPLLLGRPVEFDEGMPNIGAGNLPIAFGDFRAGYLINDRTGIRVLRDPYTNKPFVSFYVTKRVGGGVKDPRAIRLLKIAAA